MPDSMAGPRELVEGKNNMVYVSAVACDYRITGVPKLKINKYMNEYKSFLFCHCKRQMEKTMAKVCLFLLALPFGKMTVSGAF